MKHQTILWYDRIGVRLTILCLACVALFWGATSIQTITDEQRILREQVEARGHSLSSAIAIFCVEPLLVQDYPILDTYAENLIREDTDVVFVRVVREDGRVVSEIPHGSYSAAARSSSCQIYEGYIRVDPTSGVLGMVELGLSTSRTDEFVSSRIRRIAFTSTLACFCLAIILSVSLTRLISKRLLSLERQAQLLGRGDLDTSVGLSWSGDELGHLAQSLEAMRVRLREKVSQLRELTDHLKMEVRTRKKIESSRLWIGYHRVWTKSGFGCPLFAHRIQ